MTIEEKRRALAEAWDACEATEALDREVEKRILTVRKAGEEAAEEIMEAVRAKAAETLSGFDLDVFCGVCRVIMSGRRRFIAEDVAEAAGLEADAEEVDKALWRLERTLISGRNALITDICCIETDGEPEFIGYEVLLVPDLLLRTAVEKAGARRFPA